MAGVAAIRARTIGLGLLTVGVLSAAAGFVWIAVAAVLAGFLMATRRLAGWPYAAAGMVAAAALLLAAARSGLSSPQLGLGADELVRSLPRAALVALLTVGAVLVAARVPRLARLFDTRPQHPLRAALLDVPFGTVLVEEVAFRAVLPALLAPLCGVPLAVLAASVLFGLWHVPGALEADGDLRGTVGTVAVTTAGGVVLCALRYAAGSLLVPAALHWALNGTGTLASARRTGAASHGGA